MNRKRFVAHLTRHGSVLVREGAKHSVFRNLSTGMQASVPRHTTLLRYTAERICKQLGAPPLE